MYARVPSCERRVHEARGYFDSSWTVLALPLESVTCRSNECFVERSGDLETAKTIAETTNPNAPAIMRMTPTVESRKPVPWYVMAQYMIAPAAAAIALSTIPGSPISHLLLRPRRNVR